LMTANIILPQAFDPVVGLTRTGFLTV